MSPQSNDRARWAKVTTIFHDALEVAPRERGAFVDRAVGGDEGLRAEVLSLLEAHESPGGPLDVPDAGRSPAETFAADAPGTAEIGRLIGPYRIERVLGAGGMGVVYLAEDTRLGRRVALKALAWLLTDDERHRERLRREARAAAALTHPNIATVFALEEIDGQSYLATEYIAGETLRARITRGPSSIGAVLPIAREIAAGLAAAHRLGIVHRDLKPENVIETPDGGVKILDFGIAWQSGAEHRDVRLTDDGTAPGTPGYMSPEQIRAERVDARSDVFAFGVVLHELLAGVAPFAGATPAATMAKILEGPPPPLATVLPAPPPAELRPAFAAMQALILKCLSREPRDRFASAEELVGALDGIAEGRGFEGRKVATSGGPRARWAEGPVAPGRFWWQFHQAAASLAYLGLLVPLWWTRGWQPGAAGQTIFLVGLAAALVATTLRLHLWFASRELRTEWPSQRVRLGPWIRAADWIYAADLLAAGLAILSGHDKAGPALIAAAIGMFVSSTVIEPATARAALAEDESPPAP